MYSLTRKLLFLLDSEVSHELSLDMLSAAERLGLLNLIGRRNHNNETTVMGIRFPNPVGLAAGLDKNADCFNALGHFGFGFIEVGTVTPLPQPGNPRPRLFRLPESGAIINRMGFNNKGVDHLVQQVSRRRYKGVLGINIGKNKTCPDENALADYITCLQKVYCHADYVTINISSPNTPGLRKLQFGEPLKKLLEGIKNCQAKLATRHGHYVPIAVKIAPDMTEAEFRDIAETFLQLEIDGVIATNTTVSRENMAPGEFTGESGGLSGQPLLAPSTLALQTLVNHLSGKIPVIGVGGIMQPEDALEKVAAGAALVQIYTGFIYRGPKLIAETQAAIAEAHQGME